MRKTLATTTFSNISQFNCVSTHHSIHFLLVIHCNTVVEVDEMFLRSDSAYEGGKSGKVVVSDGSDGFKLNEIISTEATSDG
jgi:hypothetical protein